MKSAIPIEKNQYYSVAIEDIGKHGEGIGKINGFTVFVAGGLPGDKIKVKIVKIKKSYAYGILAEIQKPSPDRVQPPCPYASKCGGCQLQHLNYTAQLQFKTKKVKEDLERIGGIKAAKVLPAIGMETPYHYRNKAQFPVAQGKNAVEIGFYAPHSHRIVDLDHCLLQQSVQKEILKKVRKFIEENNIPPYQEENHTGLVRHILTKVAFATGEIMVCLVLNGTELPHQEKLIKTLTEIKGMTSISININQKKTNVILGNQTKFLWGSPFITDYIGSIQFEISPQSFFQVNPVQMKVLYEKALALADLTGTETVLDLYCGIGTISLFFAQKAKKVIGIEAVPEAVEDAKRNAFKNGFTNVEFFTGLAEQIVPEQYQNNHLQADVIVVDPPRKGCELSVLETMVSLSPKKIIYISCDSATFARDVKYLCSHGYLPGEVQPVDQFCHTTHVESVVSLTKSDQ